MPKTHPHERSTSKSVLPGDIRTHSEDSSVFQVPLRLLITVLERTVRLSPLSTAIFQSGGFAGASEGALSPWHCSRILWSGELDQQCGQTEQVDFATHTKTPPPLNSPSPPPILPPNLFNRHTVTGQRPMLCGTPPKTGWSAQQDNPTKERLTTPLPRIQMGMYLLL